ncbi:MAG: GNAT family N-acetyltransferase [Flavobacteriaceae bacterium]|nr:GNAT family N-acetyltransferase [Flavobacteriaceae bacterium]
MKQIRLKNITDNYFKAAWEIYEDAFPLEERRLLDDQACVLKNSDYHFDVLIDDKQLIGFILWWDLDIYRYVDHFATSKQLRNKGLGRLILDKFINNGKKPIILEVELPTSTINHRRIKFYQRIGFKLNNHHYETPPIQEGQPPLQLLLMSYPNIISANDVKQFVEKCHPIIFER